MLPVVNSEFATWQYSPIQRHQGKIGNETLTMKTSLLFLEFLLAYIFLPLFIHYGVLPNAPVPSLLLMAFVFGLVVWGDATFDRSCLLNVPAARRKLLPVLLRSAFLCLALGVAVWWWKPQLLFSLIKRSPGFWALMMVIYPLFSVYPQEFLFRAYFFHRYQTLFGTEWPMIAASALSFGFVHIVLGNWIAVVLSAIGGVLFASTYRQSRSLLLVCIEHAIFGNFIFTIGLGLYFYHGNLNIQ